MAWLLWRSLRRPGGIRIVLGVKIDVQIARSI